MVKRLTLLLCLLAGGARATVITTSASGNLSALSFGVSDTIIVANTHTLTVDAANSLTTPIVRMIFVRSGGTLAFSAGMGLMCNAVVLGNRASAPFSSANGGTLTMAATSYLYLRHDAGFTYDVEPGPNSTVTISVNVTNPANAAQIYMDTPATNGYGRFYVGNTTAAITLSGVRFKGFIRAFGSGGVEFNASGRAPSTTTLFKCFFDTSNVAFINVTGHKVNQCTFNLPVINNNGAVYIAGGVKDTVWASTITVDANGGAEGDQKGIYINGQDSTVIQGTTVQELNSTSFGNNSYGILIGGDYAQIKHCTLSGFGFTIGTASTADISGRIDSCYGVGTTTTHEWAIFHAGDTGWTITNNDIRMISGGGRSALTFYPSSDPAPHAYIYYNTINAEYGGSPASCAIAFENTGSGDRVYNGVKMVGNVLIGDNTGFNRAEMIFGTTTAQTVTVNFSEFKKNAFDSCYYFGSSSATYPYSRLDSNKHDQTAFGFVDSANGDFRLDVASPLINCGDSAYAVSVFGSAQASKAPFDIGYYQSYTLGTCGGSSTPTGACCISYTCNTGYTAAQCSTQGGTYQGDGTTTCTNCTLPQPQTGTFPHFAWIRTAAITYGLTDSIASKFLGRVGTDLVLNMSNTAYGSRSGNWDNYHAMNQYGKNLNYLTASSYRSGSDLAELTTYCGLQGQAVVNDSFFIKVNTGTIGLYDVQSQGAPCAAGHITYTTAGNYLEFCGWTTSGRWEWDYTKRMARDFQIWRATKYMSGSYTASDGTKYAGVIEDENTTYKAAAYNEPPGNSMAFPHGSGAWVSGSAGSSQCGPWTGYTYAQILDSLTNLKQNVWLKQIGDTGRKYTGFWFANSVTYGAVGSDKVPGDIVKTNTGVWPMENALFCLSAVGQGDPATWNNETWKIMDTIYVRDTGFAIVWCNVNRLDTVALVAAGGASPTGTARAKLQRLCYYYMAHHPDRTYFMLTSNSAEHTANDYKKTDTLYKFTKAIYHNIGRPTGLRTAAQTGTDGAGQAYTIYRRNFQNGVVIYRADNGSNRGDASAVTFSLGATYYPAFEDSSTGAATSTTTIRNCEGKIFLTSTAASTGNASIDDVSVTEGGDMTFTVTLSAAQSVVTTLSYSTSNGTATGSTSCSGSTDYVSTIGGKSIPIGATSTTITIPTCNRASCQASRNFTVTFNVTSPATITVTDPTGTGTILDDDCGTTYGKTYKGNIVIKGKVKP